MQIFKLAEASGGGGLASLFNALGLNVQALALNTAAFLVIVWILGRFVYPHLIKALDAKKDQLQEATRLEREAAQSLQTAEAKADAIVSEAREGAEEILATAKDAAAAQLEEARVKSQAQAEHTIAEAREQLARDVAAARKMLRNDTAKLVAAATETVLDEKLDSKRDADLIGRSLETS